MRKIRQRGNSAENKSTVFTRLKPKFRKKAYERKIKFQKKWIVRIYIFIGLLFLLTILLITAQFLLAQTFFGDRNPIVRPSTVLQFDSEQLKSLLVNKNISTTNVRFSSSSGGLTAEVEGGPKVYFSNSKDLGFQVVSLKKILTRLIIKGEKARLIDLRGDKPLVKF